MNNDIPEDDFDEQELFRPQPKLPSTSNNPLAGYFRVPGLNVPLPTRGAFFPKGDFEPTLAGDVPVYPMKAADEILLRSPDALMSGYAIEKLLSSCVPSIHNPRLISTPDLDVLLLAIRAATYGDVMEIEVVCPECKHDNAFDCHLPSLMSKITFIDPINEVRLSDEVIVRLRPYNLATATKVAMTSFNEQRTLQSIEQGGDEEALKTARNETFSRLTQLNLEAVSDCIISVSIPDAKVTDSANILEFLSNTGQAWVKKIEDALEKINMAGIDKKVDVVCTKCNHTWKPEIEFDPTSFFGNGS